MSVQVRFYTVLGRHEEYEAKLRELISKIRSELKKRNIDPDCVNLMLIKIKEEIVDTVLKIVREGGQPPEHLKNLVDLLKSDNIEMLPAIVVNNRKVCEGYLIEIEELEKLINEEVEKILERRPEKPVEVVERIEMKPVIVEELKREEVTSPSQPVPAIEEVSETASGIYVQQPVKSRMPENCAECIYYGFNTRYCFLLGRKVDDITRPPCRRETFKS